MISDMAIMRFFQAQLRMQSREVPRSSFQFEFDLERRILAEAELQRNPHLRASTAQTSQANGEANLAEVSPFEWIGYSDHLKHNSGIIIISLKFSTCFLSLPFSQDFGECTRGKCSPWKWSLHYVDSSPRS